MSRSELSAYPLLRGRVHEVCGPGAPAFLAMAMGGCAGPVLYVRQVWSATMIHPVGLVPFVDPARVLMAQCADQAQALAVAEDGLRDGSVPFVAIDLTAPLSLTAGRRLQLAAKAGRSTGLCLIPDGMGSPAAETRWRCAPVFDAADSTLQRWDLIKNKSGTIGGWHVRWHAQTRRVHVVSPAGGGPGSAPAPG